MRDSALLSRANWCPLCTVIGSIVGVVRFSRQMKTSRCDISAASRPHLQILMSQSEYEFNLIVGLAGPCVSGVSGSFPDEIHQWLPALTTTLSAHRPPFIPARCPDLVSDWPPSSASCFLLWHTSSRDVSVHSWKILPPPTPRSHSTEGRASPTSTECLCRWVSSTI